MINCHIKHRNSSEITGRSHQRGITLIVGVIFLAMLMLITVIGFRNTTLSERMTGNAFDRTTSFQSAENAAKEAEEASKIFALNNATTKPKDGYYQDPLPNGGNTDFWTQGAGATIADSACDTTTPFNWTSCSKSVDRYKFETNANEAKNDQPAQYVIEKLSAEGSPLAYRVTTRSTGGSGDAEVILQMIHIP